MHFVGIAAEGQQYPPQQQGQLGRLGTQVTVSLVNDNPPQLAL